MLSPGRGAFIAWAKCVGRTAVGYWAESSGLTEKLFFTETREFSRNFRLLFYFAIKSRLVVFRFLVGACALGALVCPGTALADEAQNERVFAEFVREGDRARLTGQTREAVEAYEKAIALRQETRVIGRLGLSYLDGGLPVKAASYLLRAMIDISDVPQGERPSIKDGYERARSAVARVKVDLSHVGADVLVDEKLERSKTDANVFFFFTTPGHHEFRATLAGYDDAISSMDAKKGETVLVSLTLKAHPQPSTSESDTPTNPELVCPACKSPPLQHVETHRPWSFGLGATALSGAISYVPALGILFSADRQISGPFSVRLDARAAWSPQYVTTRPLRGFTYAGMLEACANQSIYFGCLLGHVGAIGHSLETEKPKLVWKSRIGFGATIGIQAPLSPDFSLRVGADCVVFSDRTQVTGGTYVQRVVLWSGPPVLGALNLTLVWHPELRVLHD